MRFTRFFPFFCIFFVSTLAFAGTVVKSKGKKVYIIFEKSEGGTFASGDLFNLTDSSGKKIGLVELKKVKGLKAIGLLRKGKAAKGSSTLFRSVGKKSKKMKPLANASSDEDESESSSSSMSTRWGGQFTYGMAKQDVVQDTATSSQSGSLMGLKILLDYPIFPTVSLRGGFGADQFSVAGTGDSTSGATNTDISTKITFLSVDALLQWKFVNFGSTQLYLLGGMGILHPLSKSSDSIDPSTITSLAVGEIGGGFEFRAGSFSIPVDLTYYVFPKGETVSTSVIAFKIGMFF